MPQRKLALPPPVNRLRDGALFGALARGCAEAWREGGTGGATRAAGFLGQMLLELGATAGAAARPVDSCVGDLIETVREDPGRYWSVSALARRAGLSRSQFARRVVAVSGLSPERLLIQLRIERAKHLLRETDMRITAVAEALGYADVYYFSRQFARVTGQTATVFRSR